MQPDGPLDQTENVVLPVAAIHPTQAIVDETLGHPHTANPFQLSTRCCRIRCDQIRMVHPVCANTGRWMSSSVKIVFDWRMDFKTKAFWRAKRYAFGDAGKTGRRRYNRASSTLNSARRFSNRISGQCFQPNPPCVIGVIFNKNEFSRSPVTAQPSLSVTGVGNPIDVHEVDLSKMGAAIDTVREFAEAFHTSANRKQPAN